MADSDPSSTSLPVAREVWRLYGPTKVAVAILQGRAPHFELRVSYEPESPENILAREYGSERTLLEHAGLVREELLKNGWLELGPSGRLLRPTLTPARVITGVTVTAAIAALWTWRRHRRRQHAAEPLPAGTPAEESLEPRLERVGNESASALRERPLDRPLVDADSVLKKR
jgi:hypothetical protein